MALVEDFESKSLLARGDLRLHVCASAFRVVRELLVLQIARAGTRCSAPQEHRGLAPDQPYFGSQNVTVPLPLSTGNTLIVCEKAKSAWLRDSFIGESPSLIHKWLGGKVKVQALE
jgi:hypothetical protein